MVQQPENVLARVYDFAAYRMQRIARARHASGAKQQFLWGYPASGAMQTVEFSTLKSTVVPFSAQAR